MDANALMMPFQFPINLDLELGRLLGRFELVVPSTVIAELERVAAERRSPEARAALRLAARYRMHGIEGAGDDAVLAAAIQLGAVLLTNDAGLRTICLRGRNHLELV